MTNTEIKIKKVDNQRDLLAETHQRERKKILDGEYANCSLHSYSDRVLRLGLPRPENDTVQECR